MDGNQKRFDWFSIFPTRFFHFPVDQTIQIPIDFYREKNPPHWSTLFTKLSKLKTEVIFPPTQIFHNVQQRITSESQLSGIIEKNFNND